MINTQLSSLTRFLPSMNSACLTPHRYRLHTLLLIAVVLAVLFESTQPATINNNVIPNLDKIAHFFVFGLIAWLFASVLSFRLSPRSSYLTAFILVSVLGCLNEYIQSFTPGRFTELNDVYADMAGAAFLLIAWHALRQKNSANLDVL